MYSNSNSLPPKQAGLSAQFPAASMFPTVPRLSAGPALVQTYDPPMSSTDVVPTHPEYPPPKVSQQNNGKFRRYDASDMCIASGTVADIGAIFTESQKHPLAPHLLYVVNGVLKLDSAFPGTKEYLFSLMDSTGALLCRYNVLDTNMMEEVGNGEIVRIVGSLLKSIGGQILMQVVKIRPAKEKESRVFLAKHKTAPSVGAQLMERDIHLKSDFSQWRSASQPPSPEPAAQGRPSFLS